MQHAEVASALQEALLFLSCGHPEGFGLPLAEAIACGCMVVGYHGLAGRDFALPHMKVVEFGDLLGLLKGVEQELARFDAAPEAVIQERLSGIRSNPAEIQPGGRTRLLPENMGPNLPLNALTRVQRFDGRDLGPQAPHIAVLGSCKLGNFVASLPLLRLLRRRYPEAQIDFWGSEATADFERALCGKASPSIGESPGINPILKGSGRAEPTRGDRQRRRQRQGRLAHSTWRSTATVSTR